MESRKSRSRSASLESQAGKRRSSSMDGNNTNNNSKNSSSKRSKTENDDLTPSEDPPKTGELGNPVFHSCQEIVEYFTEFPSLPDDEDKLPLLEPLSDSEREQLEGALGFREPDSDGWREDWSGNLCYADDDIVNPVSKAGKKNQSFRQNLYKWAENNPPCQKLLANLIRFVYNMKRIAPKAKTILASADFSSVPHMEMVIRRTQLDYHALEQDGWTTVKSEEPSGAIGGPFLIGYMIRWQGSDAVVTAYVHDRDYGDLWKAFWPEDLVSFDLEAVSDCVARLRMGGKGSGIACQSSH